MVHGSAHRIAETLLVWPAWSQSRIAGQATGHPLSGGRRAGDELGCTVGVWAPVRTDVWSTQVAWALVSV